MQEDYKSSPTAQAETFTITLLNPYYDDSQFLENKINNIFDKRDNLDADPLIQEIRAIPRSLSKLDELRNKIVPGSGDMLLFSWDKRDENGQYAETYELRVKDSGRVSDVFNYYTYNPSENSRTLVSTTTGSAAPSEFRKALLENSDGYSSEEFLGTSNTIEGEAIDGYISGATIFIDQNFNFLRDSNEYTATTDNLGGFQIDVLGNNYECLLNRPIIADVPVGAVDSTLGEVTQAYEMILPSINDAGSQNVVISPFTSLLSEAIIKGKQDANLKEELSYADSCGSTGNSLASSISTNINEIKNTLETTYGITLSTLLGDFIENGPNGKVSETTAQNIANFFSPMKELKDNISTFMTNTLGIPVTANISFERGVIDQIFGDESLTDLPLNFYSIYSTDPNDLGWRREVSIKANGARVDLDGKINAFKCLENTGSVGDYACDSSILDLDNLGRLSEDYRQTVAFYYGDGGGSPVTIGKASGLMVVDASDVKYFFTSEGEDRFACSTEEQIQLRGSNSADINWEYKYQTNYNEYNTNINACANTDGSTSNIRRGSIEILRRDVSDIVQISTAYVIPNIDDSSLFTSTPKKLIENFETVDPKGILTEISTFPADYGNLNEARALLTGKEELQFTWSEKYDESGNFKTQYILKIYSNSHPDNAQDALTVSNYEDGNLTPITSSSYEGAEALNVFDSHLANRSDQNTRDFYAGVNTIEGEVIDGYIDGANIYIDQNFNFVKDDGEIATTTLSDGSFKLSIYEGDNYECLVARPIVADVPVGAVDSTLGTVTQAYQMILPSISDAGTAAVVVSPFTTILSEAIVEGKEETEGFVEDLTFDEGCTDKGDAVASSISSKLAALENSIETNFGIEVSNLYTDFIELNSSGVISEQSAINIAKVFPYLQKINDEISEFLTNKYNKTIRANAVLDKESLDIIFSGNAFDKLPLSFTSIYETEPNASGWFQREEITASGADLSIEGVLSREHCVSSNEVLCNVSTITLENIANTATTYFRQSNFINENVSIEGVNSGSIAVYAWDARDWRNDANNDVTNWQNNRARECRGTNDVQFQTSNESLLSNFHYDSYWQGYGQADCTESKRYYFPKLNIATIPNRELNDNSIQVNYYIPDVVRTGISNNLPFDFIKNRVTINPSTLIQDLASLERFPKDIQTMRRKLIGDDYVSFSYQHDPNTSYFEFGTFPRNDTYVQDGDFNNKLYGQAARDAWLNELKTEAAFDASIYGTEAPGSKVLGRLTRPWITFQDYYGSSETAISYDVYPTYDAATKTLDLSLKGASLDLENIQTFLDEGIGDTPIDAEIYINPDNAVSGTMPLKLYLYHGNDDVASETEDYFSIEFDIDVSASTNGLFLTIEAGEEVSAKYYSGSVIIEKTVINESEDTILIMDDDDTLQRPASLTEKVLRLLQEVSDEISGIKNFFSDGGEYFFKVDMGGGDKFSIVDYYYNTVDIISGTFKTNSNPSSGIFVRDLLKVDEGTSQEICFFRRAGTNDLAATSFDIGFEEIDRPGRGADNNDFTLSANSVSFDAGEVQKCVTITATSDKFFDWIHEARFNLSNPTSGEDLARNEFLVRIFDKDLNSNRFNGIPSNPGQDAPMSGTD